MSKQAIQFSARAKQIAKSLGIRVAAGFLRNREVPLEDALRILGFPVRHAI